MASYLLAPVDNPISAPEGKLTAVLFAQLAKVRWLEYEIARHGAVTCTAFPMADCAVVLIFKFAAGKDLAFLSQARGWAEPQRGRPHKSSEASHYRPSFGPSNCFALPMIPVCFKYSNAE